MTKKILVPIDIDNPSKKINDWLFPEPTENGLILRAIKSGKEWDYGMVILTKEINENDIFKKIVDSKKKIESVKLSFDIDTGAPIPEIISHEHDVTIRFYIQYTDDQGYIKFDGLRQFKFGYPNEEAISGHPYFEIGLMPYDFYEVFNSRWIESIKEANKVHPHHSEEMFKNDRHFILPLHDNTFEIVAKSYEIGVIKQ